MQAHAGGERNTMCNKVLWVHLWTVRVAADTEAAGWEGTDKGSGEWISTRFVKTERMVIKNKSKMKKTAVDVDANGKYNKKGGAGYRVTNGCHGARQEQPQRQMKVGVAIKGEDRYTESTIKVIKHKKTPPKKKDTHLKCPRPDPAAFPASAIRCMPLRVEKPREQPHMQGVRREGRGREGAGGVGVNGGSGKEGGSASCRRCGEGEEKGAKGI
ncbi:hypothetical protein B0H16DRAFT_1456098 [Mycena metata]|uniref:Uncharacterized protein n=1 Tax=Mycena metata TaxID=1033252 RepID=A0AAD7NIH1_9AGAR|nr:hypothetical protein B0H16DRAFT_1456098 [Mycena metata]